MWRRFLSWLGEHRAGRGPRFTIHKRYLLDLPVQQYDARRPLRILSYLEKHRLLKRGMLRRPGPVSLARLQLVHERRYLESLELPGALEPIVGIPLDTTAQDRFLSFQRLMTGGTIRTVVSAAYRNRIAVNLGGGFHHAAAAQGSGFCVFNDVAVAIVTLRRKGFDQPILVIDLDLHDGDGTRSIFAADPTVHTYSIHNQTLGTSDAVESTCIALGGDVDDATYLNALRESLPPVVERFAPGLVIYLAGSDPSIDDRLGDWRITLDGMLLRDQIVMELIRGNDPDKAAPAVAPGYDVGTPSAILLAGGYGPRAWRHGAAFFSWLLTGNSDLDIPLELELPVGHYRRLARLMRKPGLRADEEVGGGDLAESTATPPRRDPSDDWGLREDDLTAAGAQASDTLFLGVFTRYGVELALQQSGLLDRLRTKGFKGLSVHVHLDDPQGHTIRIQTRKPQPLTLIETKLRLDRAVEPGRSFLSVEWLLIQDTRHQLVLDRPLLPGQKYPGLGLLRDMAAVLIVLCERLDLDGLSFTPTHFHLAALARPMATAAAPFDEARFQALRAAVSSFRLRDASKIVEDGGVVERTTGDVLHWKPARLVIPVSADLRRRYGSEAFKTQVRDKVAAYDLIVAEDRSDD